MPLCPFKPSVWACWAVENLENGEGRGLSLCRWRCPMDRQVSHEKQGWHGEGSRSVDKCC